MVIMNRVPVPVRVPVVLRVRVWSNSIYILCVFAIVCHFFNAMNLVLFPFYVRYHHKQYNTHVLDEEKNMYMLLLMPMECRDERF